MKFRILVAVSALTLSGCEVDPLNTQVQNPSHRAAFQTASGVVSSDQALRVGQAVDFVITDAGYKGSGQATDINSFRPVNAISCEGSRCPPTDLAALSNCTIQTGGVTACTERNEGVLDTFTFYPDQRLSVDIASGGRFVSGVWYQSPVQQRRAATVYARMTEGFIAAYGPNYARVADERAATIDAIADAGAVAAGISNSLDGGTPSISRSVRPTLATGPMARCLEDLPSGSGYSIGIKESCLSELEARTSSAPAGIICERPGSPGRITTLTVNRAALSNQFSSSSTFNISSQLQNCQHICEYNEQNRPTTSPSCGG